MEENKIEVINRCNGLLILSTEKSQNGEHIYRFQKYGDTKNILYDDLISINKNHPNFLNKGYYYILDSEFVEKNGLGNIYKNLPNTEEKTDNENGLQIFGFNQQEYVNLLQKISAWNNGRNPVVFCTKETEPILGYKFFETRIDEETIAKYAKELNIEDNFVLVACDGGKTVGTIIL